MNEEKQKKLKNLKNQERASKAKLTREINKLHTVKIPTHVRRCDRKYWLSKTQIKKRGWTEKTIENFLPPPQVWYQHNIENVPTSQNDSRNRKKR